MLLKLSEIIQNYNKISIFRHANPDGDALGSQYGLAQWIRDNFPDKQVAICGNEYILEDFFTPANKVEDDFIQNSLAIVLDCANTARIDDKRYIKAKSIIKIDHHPNLEPYGHENYVNTKAAATCELLTLCMIEETYTLSIQAATYLYIGILTDTLSFKTNNITERTFLAASHLVHSGIDLVYINQTLYNEDLQTFYFKNELRQQMKIIGKVSYVIYDEEMIQKTPFSANKIRSFVNIIGNIKELDAWALFTEENGEYSASLRSKHIDVSVIANQFNGGGHKNASGIKNLTKSNIDQILMLMNQAIDNQ